MGSLTETQEQIEKELRYQSSLDLSEDAYALICNLPLARDLQQQVRWLQHGRARLGEMGSCLSVPFATAWPLRHARYSTFPDAATDAAVCVLLCSAAYVWLETSLDQGRQARWGFAATILSFLCPGFRV